MCVFVCICVCGVESVCVYMCALCVCVLCVCVCLFEQTANHPEEQQTQRGSDVVRLLVRDSAVCAKHPLSKQSQPSRPIRGLLSTRRSHGR